MFAQGASILRGAMSQSGVDTQNAAFWDTLCGWNLAQESGGSPAAARTTCAASTSSTSASTRTSSATCPRDFVGKKVLEVELATARSGS